MFVKRKVCILKDFFGKDDTEVMILKLLKNTLLFSFGGLGYVLLELLYRGRSHSSMFFAGGSCFLLLGKLSRTAFPPPAKALAGSGIITAVELLTGLIVNRNHRVWDYRNMPFHFQGQICLAFSLLWMPVGLGAMRLYRLAEKVFFRSS